MQFCVQFSRQVTIFLTSGIISLCTLALYYTGSACRLYTCTRGKKMNSYQESSSDEEELVLLYLYRSSRKRKNRRRFWVHSILQKRKQHGEYHRLVKELEMDGERFQQYFRLSKEQFEHILGIVDLIYRNKTPTGGSLYMQGKDLQYV